jgi:hypothetical protein
VDGPWPQQATSGRTSIDELSTAMRAHRDVTITDLTVLKGEVSGGAVTVRSTNSPSDARFASCERAVMLVSRLDPRDAGSPYSVWAGDLYPIAADGTVSPLLFFGGEPLTRIIPAEDFVRLLRSLASLPDPCTTAWYEHRRAATAQAPGDQPQEIAVWGRDALLQTLRPGSPGFDEVAGALGRVLFTASTPSFDAPPSLADIVVGPTSLEVTYGSAQVRSGAGPSQPTGCGSASGPRSRAFLSSRIPPRKPARP